MKKDAVHTKLEDMQASFEHSEKRTCKNCMKGMLLGFNDDILCREKGVVSSDYFCSSHRFMNMDDFKKIDFFRCNECEFFIFHSHESIPDYGVCEMFSVRKCNGSNKRACSKFIRRRENSA